MKVRAMRQARRSMAARRSQSIGARAEFLVRSTLALKGLAMIERINVGWAKVGHGPKARYIRCAPVSGDWRALIPGGVSVLVEVKYRSSSDRLRHGSLQRHQVAALNEHHRVGGVSLLAWVHPKGVHVLRWPIVGFVAGTSLDIATAVAAEWSWRGKLAPDSTPAVDTTQPGAAS